MSPQLRSRNGFSVSAIRNISLSLSAGMLLVAGGAGAAFSSTAPVNIAQSTRSNVRIPEEPQADDPSNPNGETQTADGARFTCELVNGEYTVMYHPQTQDGESYAWATPTALGGGWTPEARCSEISRRLEAYRPDGLQELRTAVENNYNTICVTTQNNSACRIVLTVPPGQDPKITRDRVFQNLTVADSGGQTDAVNTFVDGSQAGELLEQVLGVDASKLGERSNSQLRPDGINLRPFLDREDGGTGTQLRSGTPSRHSPSLNPDNFR